MEKKPALQDWHWADVLAAIRKSKYRTLDNLARHYKLKSVCGLNHAQYKPYKAAECRIANAIGVPVEQIWPSRWHPDGTRKTPSERSCGQVRTQTALEASN